MVVRWRLELGDQGELPVLPGDKDGVLRVGCGDTVLFVLAAGCTPTLQGDPVLLVRDELGVEVEVRGDDSSPVVCDWVAEWCAERPGPYELSIRYTAGSQSVDGPKWQMVVEPVLTVKGNPLPARSVVQLTVLSRLAGPIEHWPDSLAGQAALGYNMIHFTPIQPPGESGSCYALNDHDDIDGTLLEAPPESKEKRLEVVKQSVQRLEKEHGLLSAMDIVLNHCAGSAPWLLEQPESAYNIHNCPHLLAASELDEKLAWFSDELKHGRFGGPLIRDHGEVDRVMSGVQQHVLEPLCLHEYFQLDEAACLQAWSDAEGSAVEACEECYDALKDSLLPSLGASRSGAVIPGEMSRKYCSDLQALKGAMSRLQGDLRAHFSVLQQDILGAIRGVITFERLQIKKGPVGDGDLKLIPRYFRRLTLSASAQERLGYSEEVVAHNGWVMDWPATEDFAAPSWRMVYLRRHLCAWDDTVKLRYGERPADAPFVWEYMTKYAVEMARIFHAIRLDNAHSTPLHVSQHVLARVREANPHCWIFAELFTGNFATDLKFQRSLGINALIREAMQCDSPSDVGSKLLSPLWGAHPIGALSPVSTFDRAPVPDAPAPMTNGCYAKGPSRSLLAAPVREALPLLPRHCPALLFDCTHDNETPAQKRHPRDALPNAALVAASCSSVGSVRGYDELFRQNPSVVSERKPYTVLDKVQAVALGGFANEDPSSDKQQVEQHLQISWPHGATSSVVARGSWDGWKADLALSKDAKGCWSASLCMNNSQLPLQYKFIVDGKWIADESQPTITDGFGNKNNVLGCEDGKRSTTTGPDLSVNELPGILAIKQVLNKLHEKLGQEGYTEIGVHFLADDVLAVERRSPDTGRSTWFVTRSAFWRHSLGDSLHDTAVLEIDGEISHMHVAATLFVNENHEANHVSDPNWLKGLDCFLHVIGSINEIGHVWCEGGTTKLRLTNFPPGSALVFSTDSSEEAVRRKTIMRLLSAAEIKRPLQSLALHHLNYLLFSCAAEELDRSDGQRGAYDVPGLGPLAYCGLMGVCVALDEARRTSTEEQLLSSPIATNVRQGTWLVRYLVGRLSDMPGLEEVQKWLEQAEALIAKAPKKLAPFYFDLLFPALCAASGEVMLHSSSSFVVACSPSSTLIRDLTLATAQFWGATKSAPLHWGRAQEEGWYSLPSLCAGLPHFSSGFMRNWGRDTFISLRGSLLVTGRFTEARETILVYASVVRHGLCPNLLDAANRPRFNARDATWFFMQAIQDYCAVSPEGLDFLAVPVSLKWAVSEWDEELSDLAPRNIADLMHLILSAHAKGISFREWGAGRGPDAGKGIDDHMTDAGFDVSVRLDEESGLIFGGSEANCGTWMDKMGSSGKAGNSGKPATPRDGADVEIIGLLKSTLRWVTRLGSEHFRYEGVKTSKGTTLTYSDWNKRLQENFERHFWLDPDERTSAPLTGIYRDTVGATRQWQDFQLRPNFCIAMAVAPELFTPERARAALGVAAERLVGPLGMCTLDPADAEYHGDYHNDDDSSDKAVAHGWNYHQGPEWVWPLGFFLEAWQKFGAADGATARGRLAMRWLLPHRDILRSAPWRSLPELTNSRGQTCAHSCPAQAWSIATPLAALCSIEAEVASAAAK